MGQKMGNFFSQGQNSLIYGVEKHTVGRQAGLENGGKGRDSWCIRSNPKSQICSVKQSLIGLHKGVMSLSTLHTPSRDDDQQTLALSTGEIFLSSVPNTERSIQPRQQSAASPITRSSGGFTA